MNKANFLFLDKNKGFFHHSIKCSVKAFEAEAVEIHQQPRKTINFAKSYYGVQQEVVKSTSQKEKDLCAIRYIYTPYAT